MIYTEQYKEWIYRKCSYQIYYWCAECEEVVLQKQVILGASKGFVEGRRRIKMVKVLVVGPSPTKSKGGMATVIEEIAKDKTLNAKFDIDIYESYVDGNKLSVLLFSIFSFIKFYFTKRGYDIYHIHVASYGSTFRKGWYVHTAKKWGGKVILHIHGAEYMLFYERSNRKDKIVSILKEADEVIALSADWKKKFDETFELNNCVVLENGIDVERLKPAITKIEDHPHTFVSLGRLGERKGTYDLIKAIEEVKIQVPDIKCYLAGDGDTDRCKQIVEEKKLKNNVIIVGWADFDKKLELLKKSSVLVLPSYNEGLPMAILEGMACGKAIISTTVGAIPEVISDENGILVEPGDVQALAQALIECSQNLQFMNSISKNNIKKIDSEFSMKVMHQKLAQYYEAV